MDYAIRQIAEGLGFIEGPVTLPSGDLLFTDVGAGTVELLEMASGRISRFCDTGGGANGLAVGPDGQFYLCNNGGLTFEKTPDNFNVFVPGSHGPNPIPGCIQRITRSGEASVLYAECDGNPLVAPNDLVFDAHGGFYFTDSGHERGRLSDLGGLYYGLADGSRIDELLHEPSPVSPVTQPNGCGLSPDGKRVYVSESGPCRVWSWEIEAPGVICRVGDDASTARGARLVYDEPSLSIFDSLAVDSGGFVCVGTLLKGGISVISPDGKLDAFVEMPGGEPFPTNICFGGPDMRKAYVTAAGSGRLYEMDWPRPGLVPNYWDLGAVA